MKEEAPFLHPKSKKKINARNSPRKSLLNDYQCTTNEITNKTTSKCRKIFCHHYHQQYNNLSSMLWGNKVFTHAILSTYGMHFSKHNCTHQVTPRVFYWEMLQ